MDKGMPMEIDEKVSAAATRDVPPAEATYMDIDDDSTTSRGVGLGLTDMPVTPKTPAPIGLGRQDSETIPRSIKEGRPLDKKDKKQKGREKIRDQSPEPVQRAFSFPDDIADEEAFTAAPPAPTRELKTPTKSLEDQPVRGIPRVASITDFMRSVTSLAPVQEELSDEEPVKKGTPRNVGQGHSHSTTKNVLLGAAAAAALASTATTPSKKELHRDKDMDRDRDRDSGFASDSSPHVSRHLNLKPHDDESHRDSGVHLRDSRDWQQDNNDAASSSRGAAAATSVVKKSSPLAGPSTTGKFVTETTATTAAKTVAPRTPVSVPRVNQPSPSPSPRTPEPVGVRSDNLVVKKRSTGASTADTRSVSDGSAPGPSQSQRAYSSPKSTDPTPRRVASNTSVSRLRTPEPLGLRPDSPGGLRSYTGTPPLRRVDKRVSGDLRSVSRSQQDLSASAQRPASASSQREKASVAGAALVGAGVVAAAGAAALLSGSSSASTANTTAADRNSTSTPVANEGRVRAKDMTDVYVSYYFLLLLSHAP